MDAAARTVTAEVRDRFPLLRRQVNGRPLVYLDSAATTQKPEAVIEAGAAYYRNSNANVHRGLHTLGDEATRLYEGCRGRVADLLGVAADQVTIQRSATSALNLVARGWERRLAAGDAILVTEMEHHANFVPCRCWPNVVGSNCGSCPSPTTASWISPAWTPCWTTRWAWWP